MWSVGNPGLELGLEAVELGQFDSLLVRGGLCLLEVSRKGQKVKRKWIFSLGYKKKGKGKER